MHFVILLLSIWILTKTISYGFFEIKQNNNKKGGIIVIIIAIISTVLPNVMVWFFGKS